MATAGEEVTNDSVISDSDMLAYLTKGAYC